MEDIFKNKKVVFSRLERFGFEREGRGYVYRKALSGSGFDMTVRIGAEGEVTDEVTDPETGEKYVLHLIEGAQGSFVGEVRRQYAETLREIAESCFERDVFKTAQAKEIIALVRASYGDELEFLWEKFPKNAVWRRKDTGKWYGVLLTVKKRSLGLDGNDTAEVLDLRVKTEEIENLIDGRVYFPGYHMNKKHWVSILLGKDAPTAEIMEKIDLSRALAVK